MSADLFVCSKCGCVDLIGVCYLTGLPTQCELQLCSECSTGRWHGMFPKKRYDPQLDFVVNPPVTNSSLPTLSLG